MTKNRNQARSKAPQSAVTPGASTSTATRPISSTLVAPDPILRPRTITLFCWILNVSTAAFPVDVDDNRTVGHLKKAIVKEKPRGFANVNADKLTLWKVSDFPPLSLKAHNCWKVSIAITRNLKNDVTQLEFLDEQTLLEGDLLLDIFPLPGPTPRSLHIVIKCPPACESFPYPSSAYNLQFLGHSTFTTYWRFTVLHLAPSPSTCSSANTLPLNRFIYIFNSKFVG